MAELATPWPLEELTGGPEETEAVGARIAAALRPGDVVLVGGELGAGKTTLVRGACRELGVSEPVTSPTFTIGHRYAGRLPVSHLDLFRFVAAEGGEGALAAAEEPGLLDEYLEPGAIAFVEWPDAAPPLLENVFGNPSGRGGRMLRVSIAHAGGDRRRISVEEVPQ